MKLSRRLHNDDYPNDSLPNCRWQYAAYGAYRARPPAASECAIRVAHVCVAGAAENQARPLPVVRRDHVSDHDDADVHVSIRRRTGRFDWRVRADADTRHSGHDGSDDKHVYSAWAEHRHFEGNL